MTTHWRFAMTGLVTLALLGGAEDSLSQKGETKVAGIDCRVKDGKTVYRNQGWTDDERCQFYHFSQNSRLMPYRWFFGLEDPWKPGQMFVDNLDQYGLLRDDISPYNPDGLPVGLAKTDNPYIRPPQIGFTCAFCHTGQITYKGKHYRIDGGPSMQQNFKFLRALGTALRLTLEDPNRFDRFKKKALTVPGYEPVIEELKIRTEDDILRAKREMKMVLDRFNRQGRIDPADWGPGRFDALGRGGNLIFYESQHGSVAHGKGGEQLFSMDLLRPANGPVSLPQLWGAWEKDWVLWTGAIQSPVARAMVEALSIDTSLQMYDDRDDPFPIDVQRLIFLDSKGKQLQPPVWPEDFGPTDEALKQRGKELFGQSCAGCHVPARLPEPTPHGQRWHVYASPLQEIGTDPRTASNWFYRKVGVANYVQRILELPCLKDEFKRDKEKEMYDADMACLIEEATYTVMNRHKETMMRHEKSVDRANNKWRRGVNKYGRTCEEDEDCQPSYIARPLDGIWATAPFLHNGSVPTLYALLSPVEERPLAFCVGPTIEFDPEKVGLTVRECPETLFDQYTADFHFDAAKAGNRNIGHEFRGEPGKPFDKEGKHVCDDPKKRPTGVLGCAIKPEDRKALVEYLKTIETPGMRGGDEPARQLPTPAP